MKENIMNTKYLWLLLIFIGFTACNDPEDILEDYGIEDTSQEVVMPELTSGSADFSKYVAIGNSLTAGFTDNALFIAAQNNSFPNIAANKFALAGGGSFTQPLMNDNIGGLLFSGNPMPDGRFGPRLYFDGAGPAVLPGVPTTETFAPSNGPYNNMGVPGAASFHLLYDGYGNPANLATIPPTANPYFVRMASAPDATILGDALSQAPTFVSLWIGSNDVLGYATSGGSTGTITPHPVFEGSINAIVGALQQANVQGVMANIPDVATIPHFTTVPHNPLDPSNPDFGPQIPTLNTIFGALNQVYSAYGQTDRMVMFSETEASAVVIKDESLADMSAQIAGALAPNPNFAALIGQFGLPPQAAPLVANLLGQIYGQSRQATEDDLFVLPSSTVIGTVNLDNVAFLMGQGLSQSLAGQFSVEGISLPLADKWTLTPEEQMAIKNATDNFNAVLEMAASQLDFAFVDANMLLQQIENGTYTSGNFTPTSNLVMGGTFSLDGVHPTARGSALIANEFMKAIDTKYGSNFEASGNLLDIGDYPTNYSPSMQ